MGVTKTGPYSWQVPTDEAHIIPVESKLISCEWEKSAAFGGQKTYFLVYTAFVGHGSPLTVTCSAESGRVIGTLEHKMTDNYAREGFDIPPDLDQNERIYFEVKAPALGIEGRSGSIPVLAMPYVNNLKWSQDQAENGDELTLSADVFYVDDDTPATIKIYEFDSHDAHERITDFKTPVKGEKIKCLWLSMT